MTGIVLVAAVAAGVLLVLAGGVVAWHAGPALVLTVALVLSVFSGNWGNVGSPIPLDRAALAVGLLLVLVQVVRERRLPWLGAGHVLLAMIVVYAVASALVEGTLRDPNPQFALIDQLGLVPLALLLGAPVAFATREQRGVLLAGLVLLGLYLGFTATMETAGIDALVVPPYVAAAAAGTDRATGPFLESGTNGLAMVMCAAGCAVALGSWRSRAWRLVALVAAGLCLIGILGTVTRQAWLGGALGALVAGLAHGRLRRYALPGLLATALVVVVALLGIPGLASTALERGGTSRSVWDRLNSNRAAVAMVEQQPLVGWGWGSYGTVSRENYSQAATYPVTSVELVHSFPLSIAAELGAVGLLIWLLALGCSLWGAAGRRGPPDLDHWRYALTAVVIAWFVVANLQPLTSTFPNWAIWLWIGMVYAAARDRAVVPVPAAVGGPSPRPHPVA